MDKSCPANWEVECQVCPYSKERLCDFPYIGKRDIYDIIVNVYFKELREVGK